MEDLMSVVDWSRAQFALTAMFHWLFVPLTIGLAFIVAIMETAYVKTGAKKWLAMTKKWMTLFGVNFAIGVATGIILEFEFGTNWSNYSWFVGDIFGAPLAIEGIFAFFMESTFIAVMFFGWKKFSPRFHLAATWLTAFGTILSAVWILIANAWMQQPVGMEFDPSQMRNEMADFWAVVSSDTAVAKILHTVSSAWTLGGAFVVGVSCWFLLKKRNEELAADSIKVGAWVGLAGIIVTLSTGDMSAVSVSKHQPMKLAAMEGLYDGSCGQGLVAIGMLNPEKTVGDDKKDYLFELSLPYGLSILANHDYKSFVPGINDLIEGREITQTGDTITTLSYAERIDLGRKAIAALADYDKAMKAGDEVAMNEARRIIDENFEHFGFGYLDSPKDAVPPVALTFYSFRIMVMSGCYLLAMFALILVAVLRRRRWLGMRVVQWVGILSIPIVWIGSQSGWVTAEVGRQPWVIQDLMPARAAISDITSQSVELTFWMFAVLFMALLIADVGIMLSQIRKYSKLSVEQIAKD